MRFWYNEYCFTYIEHHFILKRFTKLAIIIYDFYEDLTPQHIRKGVLFLFMRNLFCQSRKLIAGAAYDAIDQTDRDLYENRIFYLLPLRVG